jgi:hypothetical protein
MPAQWKLGRLRPVLLFALLLTCWSSGTAADVQEDAGSLRIVLEREACFGECPVYRLTIEGSGAVTFEGRGAVLVEGIVRTRIDPARVAALAARFRTANFQDLRDSYSGPGSDAPTYRLTFAQGARAKTVVDYLGTRAGMPAVVTELQQLVDETGGARRFIEGDEGTVPHLRAQGWDFGSAASAAMLVRAAAAGRAVVVRDLLAAGVPATARDSETTAIEAAARASSFDSWRHLASAGALARADPALRRRVATAAVEAGNLQILQAMAPFGFDVNAGTRTLLKVAMTAPCEEEHGRPCPGTALIRFLLAAGADPDRPDGHGNTALHYAETLEEARLLVEAGANVNARNVEGQPPAMGMMQESEPLVLYLLDRGADPHIRDIHGETLADAARANGWRLVLARLSGRP